MYMTLDAPSDDAQGLKYPIDWRDRLYGNTARTVLSKTREYLSPNSGETIIFIATTPFGAIRDFNLAINSAVINDSGTWYELEYTSNKIKSYCSGVFFKN